MTTRKEEFMWKTTTLDAERLIESSLLQGDDLGRICRWKQGRIGMDLIRVSYTICSTSLAQGVAGGVRKV